jgi:hypothetical protein
MPSHRTLTRSRSTCALTWRSYSRKPFFSRTTTSTPSYRETYRTLLKVGTSEIHFEASAPRRKWQRPGCFPSPRRRTFFDTPSNVMRMATVWRPPSPGFFSVFFPVIFPAVLFPALLPARLPAIHCCRARVQPFVVSQYVAWPCRAWKRTGSSHCPRFSTKVRGRLSSRAAGGLDPGWATASRPRPGQTRTVSRRIDEKGILMATQSFPVLGLAFLVFRPAFFVSRLA